MTYVADVLVALAFVAAGYWAWAAYRAHAFGRCRPTHSDFAPSVSVLKPLCGVQPFLYETLRSFCEQAYPSFQLVFGVSDPSDPAVHVVHRLIEEFPGLDVVLVCDGHALGTNPKLSNVVNIYKSARHDVIVLADSDVRVGPEYLRTVVAPLADPGTGLVTCLYGAVPMPGLPSTLGAMYINDWFFPSALVAAGLQPLAYAFGATIACRRDVLDALGGFESVVDYLADDYMLGRVVAESGRRVELSPLVVQTIVDEHDFRTLVGHELRWARTIRSVRPVGYLMSFVTFGLPLSLLALACAGATPAAVAALAANLVARLAGWHVTRRTAGIPRLPDACLLPLRDVLSVAIWVLSFCGRTVRWYGQSFTIDRQGRLRRATP